MLPYIHCYCVLNKSYKQSVMRYQYVHTSNTILVFFNLDIPWLRTHQNDVIYVMKK